VPGGGGFLCSKGERIGFFSWEKSTDIQKASGHLVREEESERGNAARKRGDPACFYEVCIQKKQKTKKKKKKKKKKNHREPGFHHRAG